MFRVITTFVLCISQKKKYDAIEIYFNKMELKVLPQILICHIQIWQNRKKPALFTLQCYVYCPKKHSVKSVRIQSFSGPYFAIFGLNTEIYTVS